MVELYMASDAILRREDIMPVAALWESIESDLEVAVNFRAMIERRKRWISDPDYLLGIVGRRFTSLYESVFAALPEPCFSPWSDDAFGVPLIEMVEDPHELLSSIMLFPYDDDTIRYGLFDDLQRTLTRNLMVASGFSPTDNPHERAERLKHPTHRDMSGKSLDELVELYFADTPFLKLLRLPVPFHVSDEARFEHCHIVGGTGHGKTQLMQRMIYADLRKAQSDERSVVVIDSQGDLINKLVRLDLFDPLAPNSLAERLVLIDPSDVDYPASLNLFATNTKRVDGYDAADRERVLNGVIELYETFFGEMLGAELTQKQGVIFRYLARLMLTIPDATIHTLMQLMEDGRPFKEHMDKLDGSARYFFATEFFHPSFAATKKQILKRLWGVLSTPAFERMFAQTANKLDLFAALQSGKIILVNTAKDMLKSDGSSLLGRFFIAMLAQAALERSTVKASERTPTFVYIDEAQEYFDDSIETILSQARKYRVSLTLAHQTLDQLSTGLRSSLLSNTSFKCVGGVSNKDARTLAGELRTTTDFIEDMRRKGDRSEFAVWLKHATPQAIRLSVPLGFVERQPIMAEESYAALLALNRKRYCGTRADIVDFAPISIPKATTEPVTQAPSPPSPPLDTVPPTPTERGIEPLPEPVEFTPDGIGPTTSELGKGGPQHRYVQHLIKGIAEERGFRAVIEQPVEGGSVDVALYRDGIALACEISVTSKAPYEAHNLAKCLDGGFSRVFAIATDAKRLRAIEDAANITLSDEELAKIEYVTPDAFAETLDALFVPPTETTVRGYKVKVSKTRVGITEARDRRAAVARVIAGSLRTLPSEG
ncbi:type IV secretory system conjugative DNA transfer family protein [Sphingomonas sp. SUN039]|uniref:type IV secretory system conjugative DNA transfer family protein n=1 Tax=Sphingomonas sp. SUN039 TaxID=2937787 RepID=UPI0021643EA8|nr:type IV secretion system DNA-binding domain-containing protein [Sphingomonas sp. SUN039]UVO53054.1 type IV secretion system DNA-binding domain-containing protein [Sphingomonas sp. SUN039]